MSRTQLLVGNIQCLSRIFAKLNMSILDSIRKRLTDPPLTVPQLHGTTSAPSLYCLYRLIGNLSDEEEAMHDREGLTPVAFNLESEAFSDAAGNMDVGANGVALSGVARGRR
ncbi:hypothetical protein BDZ97DRAFT_1830178 [Flammula alnicola]|nr:hypothetical protein BDZ97DRAFT_1830178 [Flammula alnicola]